MIKVLQLASAGYNLSRALSSLYNHTELQSQRFNASQRQLVAFVSARLQYNEINCFTDLKQLWIDIRLRVHYHRLLLILHCLHYLGSNFWLRIVHFRSTHIHVFYTFSSEIPSSVLLHLVSIDINGPDIKVEYGRTFVNLRLKPTSHTAGMIYRVQILATI